MPTLSSSQNINGSASDLATLTTASFAVTIGDILVVKAISQDVITVPGTPTATGVDFTSLYLNAVASNVGMGVWYGKVTADASITVSVGWSGTAGWHSMTVERWTNAQISLALNTVTRQVVGLGLGVNATIATSNLAYVSYCVGDYAGIAPS